MQGQRGFAGTLRAVDLDDTAARQPADPERQIQGKRTGGDRLHMHGLVLAQTHHRALAKLLFDLRQRCLQRCLFIHRFSRSRAAAFVHGHLIPSGLLIGKTPEEVPASRSDKS